MLTKFKKLQNRLFAILFDFIMIPISWYAAYWLRYNLAAIPHQMFLQATYTLGPVIIIQLIAFWFFGLYRGIWRFASLPDLLRIGKAVTIGALLSFLLLFFARINIPRMILPLYAWFLASFLTGTRCFVRWLSDYQKEYDKGKRVLIVGAGRGSELLLRELIKLRGQSEYFPVALVDDDRKKQGCEIHGVRVVGRVKDIPKTIEENNIELVVIAIPSAKSAVIRQIVTLCEKVKTPCRIIPGLNDIVSGRVNVKALRDVSLEDLLGREEVSLTWNTISKGLSGKTILVSGGGGSIGSELCRQIAYLSPSKLIIVDNNEFNLYSIEKDIRKKFPYLNFIAFLADVNDNIAIRKIMTEHKPQLVFHAAAYKHVPLLESQIRIAMRNNILGTYCLAQAAVDHGVESFVMVSTDKAVNPTNIMGSTKRAAEIICQNRNGGSSTKFITVRFGNVLGSAGSVVPLFKSQLEEGGPLTVTHPEVSRYFMTIPEACQLILQATVMGEGGEIFVLDMGDPIRISFLAEQMIKLSGKIPGEDIQIQYTGLRPGEKLHEELFHETEELVPTTHIKIMQAKYRKWDWNQLLNIIKNISDHCDLHDEEKLKELLFTLVPEYHGTRSEE